MLNPCSNFLGFAAKPGSPKTSAPAAEIVLPVSENISRPWVPIQYNAKPEINLRLQNPEGPKDPRIRYSGVG